MRILIILALASCVPKTAGEQAKYAADHARSNGHLDGSLQPLDERRATSFSQAADEDPMTLHHASDGEFCFVNEVHFSLDNNNGSFEQNLRGLEKGAAKTTVVVGAHDSLSTFSRWPDRSTGVPGRAVRAEKKQASYVDAAGETRTYDRFVADLEWCAPIPAISSTTKYITATKWAPSY